MSELLRPLIPTVLPPIVLAPKHSGQARCSYAAPHLTRVAYALAALAIPALGIITMNTVTQIDAPRAVQATTSAVLSEEAAVPKAVIPSTASTPRTIRVTLRDRALAMYARREARS
jgi:hypothetical protein